jgi:FKBP-type peptidyl-prolyl cis-trans isomerase FkpA
MNFKFPLVAAFVALLSLTACGGGSDSGSTGATVESPATLTFTDTVVGTGATAAAGMTVKVNYAGYLYTTSAADKKGAKFDSGPYTLKLGAGGVIAGFDQGVTGMKVGGKRTVFIPSSLGYGASGSGSIPANSGLVFDLELVSIN